MLFLEIDEFWYKCLSTIVPLLTINIGRCARVVKGIDSNQSDPVIN